MPIPKRKVKVALKKDTVSVVEPKDLQKQLNNIGLDCAYTSINHLTKFKYDVLLSWPEDGTSSSYGIYTKNHTLYEKANVETLNYLTLENQSPISAFGFSNDEIHGEWEPSDTAQGYREELFTIQYPAHFDYLLEKKPATFTGVKKSKEETSREGTVEKIKSLFINIGTELSSVVVNGLNKASLEAILVNAIGVNQSSFDKDYNEENTRVIFLVQNYNSTTEEADAVGVLAVDWKIAIRNYKEKKSETKHETTMNINVRSVLYSDINKLIADYEFVRSHLKQNMFLLDGIPPRPNKLKVYDYLPPACKDTFLNGLPTLNESSEYIDTIILYSPDVQIIYSMDNSNSDASTTYSKSVTSGFTFSSSQTLSSELTFEASCEVVKVGFKLGLSISFTEEWNETITETVSISVPPRSMAYAYQGYMQSAVLRYYPETQSYSYIDKAKFVTNILKTTDKPIL